MAASERVMLGLRAGRGWTGPWRPRGARAELERRPDAVTVGSVTAVSPHPKGAIPDREAQRLAEARAQREATRSADEAAVAQLRAAVLAALLAGGSIREVAETAGISRSTCETWGHADGWPSTEQKAQWDAERAYHAKRRQAEALAREMLGLPPEPPRPHDG